jgi:hypothetical protein
VPSGRPVLGQLGVRPLGGLQQAEHLCKLCEVLCFWSVVPFKLEGRFERRTVSFYCHPKHRITSLRTADGTEKSKITIHRWDFISTKN